MLEKTRLLVASRAETTATTAMRYPLLGERPQRTLDCGLRGTFVMQHHSCQSMWC